MTADHPTREERYAAVLHAMAVEDNPGHADWDDCATTGPCREEGQRFAALVAADPAPAQPDAASEPGVSLGVGTDAATLPAQPDAALSDDDGPECDLCERTDCPDADLPEFSEPVACTLKPVYEALRYDRCDYGCGRDITKGSIREAVRILAARAAEPVPASDGEYEAGESSGYADWIGALGEVLPDDLELTPSKVAEHLTRTRAGEGGALPQGSASVLAISSLLDASYHPAVSTEARRWRRCGKIGEEYGEVTEALLGLVGENPRKGVTHDLSDVRKELLDVALAALGAVAHLDGNEGDPIAALADHAGSIETRLRAALNPEATT